MLEIAIAKPTNLCWVVFKVITQRKSGGRETIFITNSPKEDDHVLAGPFEDWTEARTVAESEESEERAERMRRVHEVMEG